jgi:hypothetical protein
MNKTRIAAIARSGEALSKIADEGSPSERRQSFADSRGDVSRAAPRENVAPNMVHDRPSTAPAAGARSRPASSRTTPVIIEGELRRAHRSSILGYVVMRIECEC